MIVGFGNMLVTVWESVQPRATVVGFDTLTTPTYRHEALPACQSGREFDRELLDQLDLAPLLEWAERDEATGAEVPPEPEPAAD